MKRRVLYVENDHGAVGGSARALAALVSHLDRERYEPFATFARESPSPLRETLRDLGCQTVELGRRPLPRPRDAHARPEARPGPVLERAVWLAEGERASRLAERARQTLRRDLGLTLPLARAIRRHGIELVHANNNLRVNRYVYWAAAAAGVPVVAHQRFLFRPSRVDALDARLVRCVLCISRVVLQSLDGLGAGCDLRLVYDGVEVPDRPPRPPAIGAAPTVAAVGRLVGWKGQHVLIQAAGRVLARHPGARFVLVGAGDEEGAYERELRRLVQEQGIADHVELRGHVDDMGRFYRDEADIVVHSSIIPEPFGLVMAEAMAAGRPIVASSLGAGPEIVEHERSGLLFRAGDPDALADALLRLLEKPDLARDLARHGFDRVAERFDVRRTAREVCGVYAEILGDAPGRA